MADNDKSKIRYDDFIANVQPDPAKPESTIMLSGFVGHGAEGHARIYPDPTLGTWYDVPEGDIIHSAPIADSKLGGSYVWVRAAAEIKPGSAAPAATEAVQPQAAAAAIQPTPTAQTHCFICPPHTLGIHCPTQPVLCDTMQMPTPATRCFICPPLHTHQVLCPTQPVVCNIQPTPTAQTLCFICPPHTQLLNCPTQPVVCNIQPTNPMICGILPPSIGCTQGCQQGAAQPQPEAVMAAAVPPNTAAPICTLPPGCLQQPTPATHCFICPPHQTPHCTLPTVCTMPPACPPPPTPATHCFICPPHQTLPTLCTLPPGCPQTLPPGCPQTHLLHCPTQPVVCNIQPTPTAQTHCFICPPLTQAINCPTQPVVCNIMPTNPAFCGLPTIGCTQGCQQGGAQQHQEAVAAAPALTQPPQCLPSFPPLCPPTVPPLCPPTFPPVCPPTFPPVCPPGGGLTPYAALTVGHTQLLCPPNNPLTITLMCITLTCPPLLNGVFTPFGR